MLFLRVYVLLSLLMCIFIIFLFYFVYCPLPFSSFSHFLCFPFLLYLCIISSFVMFHSFFSGCFSSFSVRTKLGSVKGPQNESDGQIHLGSLV